MLLKFWRLKSAGACAVLRSAVGRRKLLALEHAKYTRLVCFERQPGTVTAKNRCGTGLHRTPLFLSAWEPWGF